MLITHWNEASRALPVLTIKSNYLDRWPTDCPFTRPSFPFLSPKFSAGRGRGGSGDETRAVKDPVGYQLQRLLLLGVARGQNLWRWVEFCPAERIQRRLVYK